MNDLSRIIAEDIRNNGPISMARFMELALYCPVCGYYERDADTVGSRGDFQSNVSVGAVFGELLGVRFAGWLDQLQARGCEGVHVVEAGAHNGQLAADILGWLKHHRADLLNRLQYHMLEPSNRRQEWQRAKLEGFPARVHWRFGFEELRKVTGGVCGIVFSNELLDAFPVHRFAWDRTKRQWFEWLVTEQGGQFVWSRGGAPNETLLDVIARMIPPELLEALPDGYVVEPSPAALKWWRHAADSLKQGWLATFDYGFDALSALLPERVNGTLRGYHDHHITSDVLSHPGEQDITAHVHLDLIRTVGEESGFRTEFFGEQGRFLVQVMEQATQSGGNGVTLDPARLRQFKTLIHPDHFGHSFNVLVQTRPQ